MERLAGKNLQKHSFRGCDLRDADLEGCDVRGADFTGADLRGANLRRVQTGLRPAPMIGLAAVAVVVSIGVGVLSAWAGDAEDNLLDAGGRYRAAGIVVLVELMVFLAVALWLGIRPALLVVAPAMIAVGVILGLIFKLGGLGTGEAAATSVLLIAAFAVIVVVAALARAVGGGLAPAMLVVAALAGMLAARHAGGGTAATGIALTTVLISRRALRGHPRHQGLRRFVLPLACAGGTRFRDADLRGARLDGARLRGSDFRGANLRGVNWERTKDRQLCRVDP